MSREVRKITFLGHFGAGNLGNECTLQAAIERARQRWPAAILQCACTDPKDVESRHGVRAFRWKRGPSPDPDPRQSSTSLHQRRTNVLIRASRRLFREFAHITTCLRILRRNDVLIVCGTGVVCDFLTGPTGWPYDLFKWSMLAVLNGGSVLFLGIGVGPINHPLSHWLIKRTLGIADFRSYRDQASRQYMEGIGFDTGKDVVGPDTAYGLSRSLFAAEHGPEGNAPVIGVGLKDYALTGELNTYQDYIGIMTRFVIWLCENGYKVRLLIGDVHHDRQVTQDVVHAIKDRFRLGDHVLVEPALTVVQLVQQLNSTDLVISPRFHNLVLASMLNKPIIALSDHSKLDSLMVGLNLPAFCLPLGSFTFGMLVALFERARHDAEGIKSCMLKRTEEYRETLDQQYAAAFTIVEHRQAI